MINNQPSVQNFCNSHFNTLETADNQRYQNYFVFDLVFVKEYTKRMPLIAKKWIDNFDHFWMPVTDPFVAI